MNSYLSQEEIDALQTSKLPTDAPFAIQYVSSGIFSVARHYGGAKVQGRDYTYFSFSDELIRDDVLKFVRKMRRKPKQ